MTATDSTPANGESASGVHAGRDFLPSHREGASRGERSDPRLREARGTGPSDERPSRGASSTSDDRERVERPEPGRAELVCGVTTIVDDRRAEGGPTPAAQRPRTWSGSAVTGGSEQPAEGASSPPTGASTHPSTHPACRQLTPRRTGTCLLRHLRGSAEPLPGRRAAKTLKPGVRLCP